MQNNWFLLESSNTEKVMDGLGVVYIVEYGNSLKIGSTKNVSKRYKQLSHHAEDYCNVPIGKCYYTILHEKFRENEVSLHKLFKNYRKSNTELFNLTLDEFFLKSEEFEFDFSQNAQMNSDNLIWLKNYLMGETNVKNDCASSNDIQEMFRKTYCTYCNDEEFNEVMYIISLINIPNNSKEYFLYLLTRMQNIIFKSNERYLESVI